jgi:hypothetical protein
MQERIFRSNFRLSFLRNQIESEYKKKMDNQIANHISVLLLILCLLSYGVTILTSFYFNTLEKSMMFFVVIVTSYFVSVVFTVFSVFAIFSKKIKWIILMHYTMYFLLFFLFVNFRYTIFRVAKIEPIFFYFLIIVELIVRLLWVILNLQTFIECLILNTLSLACIWILYPCVFPENIYRDGMINFAAYSSIFFMTVGFAYVLVRQQKMAFYFHRTAQKKANWLDSVFENMNEGFISVRGKVISYINPYIYKVYKKKQENHLMMYNGIFKNNSEIPIDCKFSCKI